MSYARCLFWHHHAHRLLTVVEHMVMVDNPTARAMTTMTQLYRCQPQAAWVPDHHNTLAVHDPGSDDPDTTAQRHSAFDRNHDVTCGLPPPPPERHTRIGALTDYMPDLKPTDEDIHYWTHGDDEEDEATVRAMIEAAEDPEEALKQRLHCGGAYVEEIIDD